MSNGGGATEFPLVGLVGPAGAGKDTVAGLLVAHHGFAQVAFADKLRAFVRAIDPAWAIAEKCLGGYEPAKRNVPGFRERLIEIGDAARDHISSEVWVDALEEDVDRLRTTRSVVISDVRRTNEAEAIWDWRGSLIAVQRPGIKPESRMMAEVIDAADYVVHNDGSLEDLEEAAADLALWVGL